MFTHRYAFPVISGILLALVFYPFYAWPLVFVALAPFFYFAGAHQSRKELFWGGFITGSIGIGPTVFSSLLQMRTLIGSETFSYLVRASSVPMLLLIACVFGFVALGFGKLRTSSLLYNSLIGAALYGAYEIFFSHLLDGYYLPALSYATASFSFMLAFASIGGAISASMLIAWINSGLAEVARARIERRIWPYKSIAVACAFFLALMCLATICAPHGARIGTTLSASIIQEPYVNPQDAALGTYANGTFSHPKLAQWLKEAEGTDLIIYPFTPFNGAAYDTASSSLSNPIAAVPEAAVGEWAAQQVSASTTVLLWESSVRNGKLYDEYALWKGNAESTYTKRIRYPLSDYAPAWTAPWNLYGHTYAIEAGDANNQPEVSGVPFGGLICSELHQSALARSEALRSPFIVAVGSDAMFPNDLVGNFSLAAARFRAAENGIAIARGNMNGPSAFINADGSLQSSLAYGKPGVLQGTLPLDLHQHTLYAIWGNWLAYAFVALILSIAFLSLRRRATAR